MATGASATPDPASLTPTGGAKDYLWLWLGGWEGEQTSPPAGNPTNYTNPFGANSGTAGVIATNCRVASARRALNAVSEDPPSWTISASDDWSAWTVAVHPPPPGPIEIIVSAKSNAKAAVTPQSILNLQKSVGTNSQAVFSITRTTFLSISSLVNAKALVTVEVPTGIEIFVTASTITKAVTLQRWNLNLPATSKANSKSNVVSSWNTSLILKTNALTRALTTPIWNARILFDAETLASDLVGLGLSYSINVVARSNAMASVAVTSPLNIYVSAAALAKAPIQVNVSYQIVKRADSLVYLEPTVETTEATVTTRYLTDLLKRYKEKSAEFQA